jgi:hypothetical protein
MLARNALAQPQEPNNRMISVSVMLSISYDVKRLFRILHNRAFYTAPRRLMGARFYDFN